MPTFFKVNRDDLIEKMKQQNKGGNYKDDRLYMPQYTDDGMNAKAVIRFLPAPDMDIPYVEKFSHYFQGIGGWYIDNCPTTLNKPCPVCEDNNRIWKDDEEFVRKRGSLRKTNYYANIVVLEDKQNPQNEGKVWLFKYGKQIQTKIMEMLDENAYPFGIEDGYNFTLKIKKKKVGSIWMPDFQSSVFDGKASNIAEQCDIKAVEQQIYNIGEFVEKSQFKSYEDLTAKFHKVIGETNITTPVFATESEEPTKVSVKTSNKKSTPKTAEESFDEEQVFADEESGDFFNSIDFEE